MKTNSLILLFIAAFLISSFHLFAQSDSVKIQTAKDSIMYTCPMHPTMISDQPGKCQTCGMDLVQKESSPANPEMNMMMCPMHGMVGMNHKDPDQKDDNHKTMKGMGIAAGIMLGVMMTVMIISVNNH